MSESRIDRMKEMVERFPEDGRARYFLAHELFRAEEWAGAAEHFETYLRLVPDDEGAGYKNYGVCLERLGHPDQAATWYRKGIDSALRHHHQGLADEITGILSDLES